MQNHHGGLLLDDGHVYTGTGHNKGFPLAVELTTGKVVWGPIRNAGENSAAIAYADGRIYMRYQNGLMILVEATPEEYRERGSFMIPEVEKESWAHPVDRRRQALPARAGQPVGVRRRPAGKRRRAGAGSRIALA